MATSFNVVPVLFACNRNYLQHAAACIASLVHNNPEFQFEVLVVGTEDFGFDRERLLRSFAGNVRVNVRTQIFKLPSSIYFPLHFHYTQETYIRFWIGELFPDYSRALYLDPDIIITRDIASLWNADLGGRTVAAVPIPGSTRPAQHKMPAGSLFFNAGVLLFDLNAWRTRLYRDICLQYLADHPERAIDSDQDILNICLMGDWVPLPFYWNVISAFYFPWHDLKLSIQEIANIRREARIIHFNGGSKPWSYLSKHPRRSDYWKYLRQTDWRDVTYEDRTLLNVIKKFMGRNILNSLKRSIGVVAR